VRNWEEYCWKEEPGVPGSK